MIALSTVLWYFVASLASIPIWVLILVVTAPSTYQGLPVGQNQEEELKEERQNANKKARTMSRHASKPRSIRHDKSCTIVVLGDIGRSPRMMYHASSLVKHGARVEIVGYLESDLHPALRNNPQVNVRPLAPPHWLIRAPPSILFPFLAPVKAIHQSINLYRTLAYKTQPTRHILLQNPPSIPTIQIALLVSFFRNSRLIIDWHNLGYSLLALRLSPKAPLVRLAKKYELYLARYADSHFAVSGAMARFLQSNAEVAKSSIHVLHDRPSSIFKPSRSSEERSEFLHKLPETAQFANDIIAGRWKLLVSSTSWTADENFNVLLDALVKYSSAADVSLWLKKATTLPKILLIITGKGPQKECYLKRIAELNQQKQLVHCIITTAWLDVEVYAGLLASADLGVSLHQSSSGLDLPMKVVDMFGAGLPVAGWSDFEAWPELVQEGVNGVGFKSATELENIMTRLFSEDGKALQSLRECATRGSDKTWDQEWDSVAAKVLNMNT